MQIYKHLIHQNPNHLSKSALQSLGRPVILTSFTCHHHHHHLFYFIQSDAISLSKQPKNLHPLFFLKKHTHIHPYTAFCVWVCVTSPDSVPVDAHSSHWYLHTIHPHKQTHGITMLLLQYTLLHVCLCIKLKWQGTDKRRRCSELASTGHNTHTHTHTSTRMHGSTLTGLNRSTEYNAHVKEAWPELQGKHAALTNTLEGFVQLFNRISVWLTLCIFFYTSTHQSLIFCFGSRVNYHRGFSTCSEK